MHKLIATALSPLTKAALKHVLVHFAILGRVYVLARFSALPLAPLISLFIATRKNVKLIALDVETIRF